MFLFRIFNRVPRFKGIISCQRQNISTGQQLKKSSTILKDNHKPNVKSPITWKTVAIGSILSGSLLAIMYYLKAKKDYEIDKERNRQIGKASIGGTFELIDSSGKLVKSEDFLGKWLLIYFGFTHCPDVCPDELEKLSMVVDKLENTDNLKVQPLFITVDPSRDTPDAVGKYVKEFSDKIIGLTGSVKQIADVCKAYRVYHSNGPADVDNDYIVDHTIIIYLVDPDGNFIDYFGQTNDVQSITNSIRVNKAKYENQKKGFSIPSFGLKNLQAS